MTRKNSDQQGCTVLTDFRDVKKPCLLFFLPQAFVDDFQGCLHDAKEPKDVLTNSQERG